MHVPDAGEKYTVPLENLLQGEMAPPQVSQESFSSSRVLFKSAGKTTVTGYGVMMVVV